MLPCPKCGFENELGRIFCHQCGNKLELDKIKPPSEGAKIRRKVVGGVRKTVRIVIELALVLGLMVVVVLICLVPEIPPVKPTGGELAAIDTKRMMLSRLVNGHRTGSVEITAGDLDAYLNTLGLEKPRAAFFELVPVTVRTEFGEGTVTIKYLSELHVGSVLRKQIYFGLTGLPKTGGGQFTLKVTGGWIGKLPIQPKLIELTNLFPGAFSKLFAHLDDEEKSLGKLTAITVTPGRAVLAFTPAPAK
jgi:hypothetical protein